MNSTLRNLSVDQKLQLIEDLWDSIAVDQHALPLTPAQQAELDRRLERFDADGNPGRLAEDVIRDIRARL